VLRKNPLQRNDIGVVCVDNLSEHPGHAPDPCTRVVICRGPEDLDVNKADASARAMANHTDAQSGETGVHAEDDGHGADLALGLVECLKNLW
jgi:hypothetical protein